MKQRYRKGLFVRQDLQIYELKCVNCGTDFIFTLDECYHRNKGVVNKYLGKVSCPCCKYSNAVHRENKYKDKGE